MVDYDVMVFIRWKEQKNSQFNPAHTIWYDGLTGIFIMAKNLYDEIRQSIVDKSDYSNISEIQLIRPRRA